MRILIPTDFSENARAAIDYAFKIFGTAGVEYHIVNVYSEPHTSADMLVSIVDLLEKESKSDLNKEVDSLRANYPDRDLNLVQHSVYGSLSTVLEKIVSESDVKFEYIVMGTTGASGLKKVFLGSNASDVLKKRIAPTLVVPPSARKDLSQILVGFDATELNGTNLLQPLLSLINKHKSEIKFAHVSESKKVTKEFAANAGAKLDPVFKETGYEFLNIQSESIANGILDHAHHTKADLLVMIYRQHNFFERLFKESQTQKMAMMTDVPLLVIPE